MKLKLDDNGNVVLREGIPVWVANDGAEIAYNVPDLVNKISAVNAESAGRRKELDDLNAKFKPFEGLDPEKAKAALETVANLEAGKLIDAGKVEEFKAQVDQGWKVKLEDKDKAHVKEIEKLTEALDSKNAAIRNLVVRGAFEASTFLREKTTLPADMAYAAFGKHFEVKEENGELKAVASLDGQPIFSRSNPGTFASPEEAIEALIEKYPYKERILRDTMPGGSGATKPSFVSAARNPWAKESWNVGEQMKLFSVNPARAKALMQEAGVPIPAGL
jgi:hypothetical protein|nr:MAG TPA: minor structural protein GP20 [Caudoviricetes sp.]